jgi:hypothetical protein
MWRLVPDAGALVVKDHRVVIVRHKRAVIKMCHRIRKRILRLLRAVQKVS